VWLLPDFFPASAGLLAEQGDGFAARVKPECGLGLALVRDMLVLRPGGPTPKARTALARGREYDRLVLLGRLLRCPDRRLGAAGAAACLCAAAVVLAGCGGSPDGGRAGAGAGTPVTGSSQADAPAASAPFSVEGWQGSGPLAVSVVNIFTGRVEAAIAAPKDAGSFPWMGRHRTWYPCGAAPDDRTFLLCDTDQYYELRLGNDGKPQSMSAPADIPVAARNNGSNGEPEFAVSPGARLAAVSTVTGAIMVLSLVTGATRSWAIPSADGYATRLSWAGDRYVAFQFTSEPSANDAGGVWLLDTRSAAAAALAASRLIISNEGKSASGGLSGVFNPVITPDGSKVVAAVWTGFIVAELAEFSARTGRLIAVLIPPAHMPGHGSPCEVLWTDPSGAHLIADCGTPGVVNGTRFTPVHLSVPGTSGI
jgi:hypothetical protein